MLAKATNGEQLNETEIVRLFEVRDDEFAVVCRAADELRKRVNGDVVSYVVNRTSTIQTFVISAASCAFSKGKLSENLRGTPYDLGLDEIIRRAQEAWERSATEVCMQGGIHPEYTGETYLNMCRAIRATLPDTHIHAFSPLEVWQEHRRLASASMTF